MEKPVHCYLLSHSIEMVTGRTRILALRIARIYKAVWEICEREKSRSKEYLKTRFKGVCLIKHSSCVCRECSKQHLVLQEEEVC